MSCSRSDKLAGNADEVRFQLNERGDVEKHPKDASDEELKNSKSKKAVHTTSLCQPNVDSERNSTIGVEFCTSPSNLTTDSENRITSQKTCDTERLCNDDKGKNVTSSLQSMCQASSNLLQEEEIDYTSKLQNKRENKPLPTGIFTTIATSRDIDAFALKRNVCAEKIEDKKSNAFEESLSRDQLVTGVMPVSEIANFKEQEAIQENGFSIDYFLERTQESNLRQNEVPKTYFLQEFQSTNFNGENTYSFDERRSNTSVVNMCDQTSMVVNESEAYSEKNSSDKSREKVAKNNEIPGLPQSITWNLPSDGFLNSHAIISPHFLRAPLFFSPSHLYPFVPLPAPLLSPQIVPLPPAVTFAGSQASYISELSQIDYFRRRPPPCFWIINRSTCSKPEIEEVCNRQFETISEIVYHISDMHLNSLNNSTGNSNEQYYYCFWKDCLRSMKPFRARYKLVNHIRVHTGERPFLCHFPSCGKRFARSENLKIHKRVHSGERPFICEYSSCSRRFTNSSDRKKHMHTHTTEKELDSITRPEKLSKQLTKHSRKRLNSDEDITPHIYVKNETLKQEKPENLLRENYQMMNSPSCVNTMLSIKSHAIIQDLENSVNHHLHQVGEKALIN